MQSLLSATGSVTGDASRNSLVGLEEPKGEQRPDRNQSEESERSIDVEEAKIMFVNETTPGHFDKGASRCNRRAYNFEQIVEFDEEFEEGGPAPEHRLCS